MKMKLTIEGNPDEIKSVLKNLSATENSQEIKENIIKNLNENMDYYFKK